jgi:hypothetical protein
MAYIADEEHVDDHVEPEPELKGGALCARREGLARHIGAAHLLHHVALECDLERHLRNGGGG